MLPTPITPGNGNERYLVQLVFELSATTEFPELDPTDVQITLEFLGHQVAISKRDHYLVLRAGEFATASQAQEFIDLSSAALLLTAARNRLGLAVNRTAAPLALGENEWIATRWVPPSDIGWKPRDTGSYLDGAVWPNLTAIIPQHQQIVEFQLAWGRATQRFTVADLKTALSDSAKGSYGVLLTSKPKLGLAMEAYAAAWAQLDRRIHFLILVIVLELLSERRPVRDNVQTFIEHLLAIAARAEPNVRDPSEIDDLTQVISGIRNLQTVSITEGVRTLAYDVFLNSHDPSPDRPEITAATVRSRVTKIYNVRSNIAHGLQTSSKRGVASDHFSNALADLRYIAHRVLLAQFDPT